VGAASAAHNLLLFLDDDMLLADWRLADVLVAGLLSRGSDCALFPRRHYARYPLLYDDEVLDRFVAGWREASDAFDHPHLFDPVRQGSPQKTLAFCFPGCFTLIRREAFDRIGGFPENYVGWGFEDASFALRAVSSLRVWNLFRDSPPLLHIDHPVSPYKSEEFHGNLARFLVEHSSLEMHWLCQQAVIGGDFEHAARGGPDTSAYLEPLRSAAAACGLRLGDDLAASYRAFIEARADAGRTPFPEHIVLHGSRADGTATPDSDFDLLALFADGTAADFFEGGEEAGPRIEVEFAEAGKFEQLAARPACHSLAGPLELAKVANAVVLTGEPVAWETWRDLLLSTALRRGRAYWLTFALGLELRPGKLGPMKGFFLASLRAVLAQADADRYAQDIELLRAGRPESLAAYLGALLDREHPDWRRDLAAGRRVFAEQFPAVWIALRWVQRHH
jgi:predicted nucleotidyltransferase